jgi:hypothetical protein
MSLGRLVGFSLAALMAGVILFRPTIALAADPVTVDQTMLTFPGTGLGAQSAAQTLTYTNNGTTSATITSFVIAAVTDAGGVSFVFAPAPSGAVTLASMQSFGVQVAFAPTSVGALAATVTATVTGQNPIITSASGTGLASTIVATPNPVVVGNVAYSAGQTVSAGVTLTNSSTTSTLHITALSIGGANPSYYTDQPSSALPVALGPGAAMTVMVNYTPPGPMAFPATLVVTSDDPIVPTQAVTLLGEVGDPSLTPNAASIVFPDTGVGATAQAQTLVVTNAGFSALTISGLTNLQNVSVVGAADGGAVTTDFSVVPPTFPLTLTPNASVSLTVSYTPLTGGVQQGAISFTTNDPTWPPAGTRAVLLSGMAMGAGDMLDPSALTYNIPTGTSQPQTTTFFSSASVPVHITSLTWLNDAGTNDFTVLDGGATGTLINPGGSTPAQLTVQFTARLAEVTEMQTLVIGLDDPAQTSMSLALSGTGLFEGDGGQTGDDGGTTGDGGAGDDGGDVDAGCPLCTTGGDACTCAQVGGVDRALAAPLLGATAAFGIFVVRRRRRAAASRRPRA